MIGNSAEIHVSGGKVCETGMTLGEIESILGSYDQSFDISSFSGSPFYNDDPNAGSDYNDDWDWGDDGWDAGDSR